MSLPASGFLSHTWREAAAEHEGCDCVEKQEITLTPRGEARTQVGHSAQTPNPAWTHTWAHRATHCSLPDFLALSRLIPAGFSCAFIFPEC